jgi:predicted nucleotidyltransferase
MVTQTSPDLKLSLNEKKAIDEFIATIQLAHGEKFLRAALFGSKARGDTTPYSDIDILLIVTDDHWKFREALIEIGSDVGLKYDVLLDLRIISKARWEYMATIEAGLYRNILVDAIPLAG